MEGNNMLELIDQMKKEAERLLQATKEIREIIKQWLT